MNPNLTPFLVWGILAWVWGIPLLTCISVVEDERFLKKSKYFCLVAQKKKKKSKCFCLVAQKKKKRKEGECLIKTNLYDISYIEVGILILSIYVHIRLLLNCVHFYSIKNFIMLHTSLHTIINWTETISVYLMGGFKLVFIINTTLP